MRTAAVTALVALSLTGLSACAAPEAGRDPATARTSRPCLDTSLTSDFRQGEGRVIYVTDRRGPTYQLESFGRCPGVESALAIGLSADTGPDDRLCVGDWGKLALGGEPRVCPLRVIRVLTPDEVAALR